MSKYLSKLIVVLAVLSIFGIACQNTSSVEDVADAPTTKEVPQEEAPEEVVEDYFGGSQRKAKSIYAYSCLLQSMVMPFEKLRTSGFQRVRAELVDAHY
jgi:hypothetical protein